MIGRLTPFALTIVLAAHSPIGVSETRADETVSSHAQQAGATNEMRGLEFTMYEWRDTEGQRTKPTAVIEAETGQSTAIDGTWILEGIHATIFDDDHENLSVSAPHGRYARQEEVAELGGGIRGSWGDLNFGLADFVWANKEGIGRSQGPVTVTKGETTLKAAGMDVDPEKGNFTLHDPTGRLHLATAQENENTGQPIANNAGQPFKTIKDLKADSLEGNPKEGRFVEALRGNVSMTLEAERAEDNVELKAQEVEFAYPEAGGETPERILLRGDVSLVSAETRLTAGEGEIDLAGGLVTFRDNPRIDSETGVQDGRAESIIIDLNSGNVRMVNPQIGRIPFNFGQNADSAGESSP